MTGASAFSGYGSGGSVNMAVGAPSK